jgi:hypothetical protein
VGGRAGRSAVVEPRARRGHREPAQRAGTGTRPRSWRLRSRRRRGCRRAWLLRGFAAVVRAGYRRAAVEPVVDHAAKSPLWSLVVEERLSTRSRRRWTSRGRASAC